MRDPLQLLPLSPANPGALYEQLIAAIKRAIADGRIRPGDTLPSVRQLAQQMMVSVITVKRAYEELEREQIIFRHQGVGTFVADIGLERTRTAKLDHARSLLRQAAQEAAEAGLSADQIRRLFFEAL